MLRIMGGLGLTYPPRKQLKSFPRVRSKISLWRDLNLSVSDFIIFVLQLILAEHSSAIESAK